jgi:hypothetical protein
MLRNLKEFGFRMRNTAMLRGSHLPFPARPAARQRKQKAGRALNRAQLITPHDSNQSHQVTRHNSQ